MSKRVSELHYPIVYTIKEFHILRERQFLDSKPNITLYMTSKAFSIKFIF